MPLAQNFAPVSAGSLSPSQRTKKAAIDPRKYKTKLCRNWMRDGVCSYEHTCCFAHGEHESRDPAANVSALTSLGYFAQKFTTTP
jgi:hypothetical protein